MLDVSLDELAARGPQQVRSGQLGLRSEERQDILQLVTEAVGAAGLVEGRPCPEAAGQRLVGEPAIEQDVHRAVRRPHLDDAQHLLPVGDDPAQHRFAVGGSAPPDQVDRGPGAVGLAQEHGDGRLLAGRKLEPCLEGGAGIHAGARGPAQPVTTAQARGPLRGAVAAEELRPVGRPLSLPSPEVEEGDAAAKLGVPGIADEDRLGLRVQGRHDPVGVRPARRAQRPLGVGSHRTAAEGGASGSRWSAPRPSAGRPAPRAGPGPARCRHARARSGCIRAACRAV